MLRAQLKKTKKKTPRDPESMECTCVIIPYVPPTDDSYMEIDWPTIKKKYNIDDGYSDDTEDEEDADEGRIAVNLKNITVVTKKDGKKMEVRAKPADFYDLGRGYVQEDNFLDDSEEYDEYVPSFLDTEYGGFYINDKPMEYRELEGALVNPEDNDHADDDGSTSASSSTSNDSSLSDGSAATDSEDAATEEKVMRKRNAKKAQVAGAVEAKEGDGKAGGSGSEKTKDEDDASERKESTDALKKNSHQEKHGDGLASSNEESDDATAATTKPYRLGVKPPMACISGMPPTARFTGQPSTTKNVKKKPTKPKQHAKKAVVAGAMEAKEGDGNAGGGGSEKTKDEDDTSERKESNDALNKNSHQEKHGDGLASSSKESDDATAATTKPLHLVSKPPMACISGMPPTARLSGQPSTTTNVKKKPTKPKQHAKKAEVAGAAQAKEDDGTAGSGGSEKTEDDASERKETNDVLKMNGHQENGLTSSSEESDDVTAATNKPLRPVGKPPIARMSGMPPMARMSGMPPTARLAGHPPTIKSVKKKPTKTAKKEKQNVKREATTSSGKQANPVAHLTAQALPQTTVSSVSFP